MVKTYKPGTNGNWDIASAEGLFLEVGVRAALRREFRRKKEAIRAIANGLYRLFLEWKW